MTTIFIDTSFSFSEPMSSSTASSDGTAKITAESSDVASASLEKIVQASSASVNRELAPALTQVESSQNDLLSELQALSTEMDRMSTQVGQVCVDEYTKKRLAECKESLARTKIVLKTVNARMRRLRTMESAQRKLSAEIEIKEK